MVYVNDYFLNDCYHDKKDGFNKNEIIHFKWGVYPYTDPLKEGRKEMFYLTTHSTHFIYGYMASHIW